MRLVIEQTMNNKNAFMCTLDLYYVYDESSVRTKYDAQHAISIPFAGLFPFSELK